MARGIELTSKDRLVVALIRRQRLPGIGKIIEWMLWLLGVEVPAAVVIGADFGFRHSSGGLVIHELTMIGDGVTVLHGVTTGRADLHTTVDKPGTRIVIGDGVLLGARSTILTKAGSVLTVGDGAVVGAGAVVTRDVPPGEVWAGNPARRVRTA